MLNCVSAVSVFACVGCILVWLGLAIETVAFQWIPVGSPVVKEEGV